ncbi:hypothetical protein CerSpe_132880 [Prunus speciosa]
MANCNMSCARATLFLLTIFICFGHFSVSAFEFQVGGTKDWVVPPTNDSKIYNDWASGNRFQVGDTIRFKYKKDSVMEVTEEEFKKCNSTRPNFFSNTGNTVYLFDHAGSFYFISGASGHCQRGQRMIVKVMSLEESPSSDHRSSGSRAAVFSVFVQLVVSYVACLLF